jgi:hypothetical protein
MKNNGSLNIQRGVKVLRAMAQQLLQLLLIAMIRTDMQTNYQNKKSNLDL